MKSFAEALCSNEKNEKIPETYDYFGGLIGEWVNNARKPPRSENECMNK